MLAFGQPLSLYSMVGFLLLIGIVKKNGIMMIDFALDAQKERKLTPRDAIYEGCMVRFRPIMMTTVAAIIGGHPHCDRLWRRGGNPPRVGFGDRWGVALFSIIDAVYHAHSLSHF